MTTLSAVGSTTDFPYRMVARIEVKWSDDRLTVGSGVVVGENDVLTAAHLFQRDGLSIEEVRVKPAWDPQAADATPLGTWYAVNWQLAPEFQSANGTFTEDDVPYDYALISLPGQTSIGSVTGTMAIASDLTGTGSVSVTGAGYPNSADGMQAVTMDATLGGSRLAHADVGATSGISGGPIWTGGTSAPELVGLWATATLQFRLNPTAMDRIDGWMAANDLAVFTGNALANQIGGAWTPDRIFGNGGDDTLRGFANEDTLVGADGDDRIEGGAHDDLLRGGAGRDTLLGGAGDDVTYGGGGNDLIRTGGGDVDRAFGNGGHDRMFGAADQLIFEGGAGRDTLQGAAGDDRLFGGGWNDTINGGAGADTLAGQDGADMIRGGGNGDLMFGGRGFDTLYGGEAADTLYGGAQGDTLAGGDGRDTLFGGDGFDQLFGGALRDTVYGGRGNDLLDGGTERDSLTGGDGADVFRLSNTGTDEIMDTFVAGVDKIRFVGGPESFDDVNIVLSTDSGADAFVNGGDRAFLIWNLDGELTADDFQFV